jgi:hypothetical protein
MKKTWGVGIVATALAGALALPAVLPGHAAPGQPPGRAAQQPEPQRPPQMRDALRLLKTAREHLEKAGDRWGGHRENAIGLTDKAIHECELALQTKE